VIVIILIPPSPVGKKDEEVAQFYATAVREKVVMLAPGKQQCYDITKFDNIMNCVRMRRICI
jgi:hypothetical protein